jgi:PAS domain S-box-containing protein
VSGPRLGLRGRVALTLAAGFAVVTAVFLLVLVPLQRDQRARLLEQDVRLLDTIQDKHQRDLVHDLLSESPEALAIDVADLVRQPRILWARVEAPGMSLSATADRAVMEAVLGAEALAGPLPPDAVLLLRDDGRADLRDASGRPLLERRSVGTAPGPLPVEAGGGPEVLDWNGRPVLRHRSEIKAADTVFGRLELLASLSELQRSEQLTRRVVLGIVVASFVVLVLALDLLLSRIVLQPVQEVARAMGAASAGNLSARLQVRSHDEIGAMASSFNAMVEDLESSKREVEGYSRNLESMVEARTRELSASESRSGELWQRLEVVLANVATGILALDADGRLTSLNDRAAEVLGLAVDEVRGRPLPEVLGAEHPLVHEVHAVSPGMGRRTGHLTMRGPGGVRRLSTVVSALPEGAGVVVALEDLTQLIATQRLEAWKEAVERVIHEIKNPLTPVGLSAQALRTAWQEDRVRFDAMFPAACDLILRSVQDLRSLIAEFTRFSRLPRPVMGRHDLNGLVSEVVAPYAASPPEGVRVETELAEALPPAEIDREQVRRVLLNVVNNGLEAMDGRPGTLLVRTFREGRSHLGVEVCDEGCGIEDVDRIFEPYYTTKAKGTGLGLVISRQVVEEHGGRIEVRSRPGEGTRLRLLLPAAVDDGSPEGGPHGAERQGDAGQRAGFVRSA